MNFDLTVPLREAIYQHAGQEQPRECCGLVVRLASGAIVYWPCANELQGETAKDRFRCDRHDYAAAEDQGEILAVVHSHPNADANPSMADRMGCEASELPWLVMGWPSGVVKTIEPEGWVAPYHQREFHHGVLDCYTLIRDWYARELKIELPDFEREDDWWQAKDGQPAQDLYMEHFAEAGFVRVGGLPQAHDVVLIQIRSDRANHGAVYVGDGVILHHLHGRLSCTDVYGGYWERHTLALLRHRSRMGVGVALKAAA